MNAKALSAVVLALCAAQVRAGAFEDQLSEFSAVAAALALQAQSEIQQIPAAAAPRPVFAKTIVCDGKGRRLRFYTRLEGGALKAPADGSPLTVWSGSAPRPDETAAKLNEYRSAWLAGKYFRYSAWSCDTQDYAFSFEAESLLRAGDEASRPVKGRMVATTRGELDYDVELSCTALF